MRKMNIILFLVFFLFSLSSCNVKDKDISKDYLSYSINEPNYDTPKRLSKDEVTYKDLFNLGNRVEISIEMEDSELKKLENDYKEFKETGIKGDLYRHCKKVTISITNYDNTFTWEYLDVGIRQKGNTSRGNILNDEDKLNGLNHFKLSFDEAFDDDDYGSDKVNWDNEDLYNERINRNFLGLSGLDLRYNAMRDQSYIREIYANYLYHASNLLNQYIGLSLFNIKQVDSNKTYKMGIYKIYEPVNKSMIKRHLLDEDILNFGSWTEEKNGKNGLIGSNYGDLYKALWSGDLSFNGMIGNSIGVGNAKKKYVPIYDRKTNKDQEYDDYLLKRAGIAVSMGNYKDIDNYVDLEYFAKTEAINYILGNPDDLRNNINNTEYYARRSDGKIITIPIDNDRVFGLTLWWNPDGAGLTRREIFDKRRAGMDNEDVSEIYLKTILADETNEAKLIYLNYIKAIACSAWVKSETFDRYFQIAKSSYGAYINNDFFTLSFSNTVDAYNDYTFDKYMELKLKMIDLSLNIGAPKEEKESGNLPTLESLKGYYGDLYIAGNMNLWKGKDFKMDYLGSGIYTITFDPGFDYDTLYLKIYDGEYWKLNWSIKGGKLIMHDTDAFFVNNVKRNQYITITINTLTKEASCFIK